MALPATISEHSFPSSDIKSAALESIAEPASQPVESTPVPGVAPTTQPTYAAPPAAAPGVAPPQTIPVEGEALDINPDTRYRVKTVVNGVEQTELLTGKEVLARQMNARSYTQNQQTLRAQQRQLLQERQQIANQNQQAQENAAILNDAGRLAVYIQGKFPHLTAGQATAAAAQVQAQQGIQPQQPTYQPPAPVIDPQGLASIGDVQAQVGQRVAELEAELGRRATAAETQTIQRIEERAARIAQETVASTIAQLQTAHAVAGYDRQIDTHINQLITDNPVLKLVPELNDLMRFRVQQMNPQTPQEMLTGFTEVANAIVEGLNAHYQQQNTAAVAAKAKLTTHGIAVPTGTTVTAPTAAASKPFASGGKADWKGLGALVSDALTQSR